MLNSQYYIKWFKALSIDQFNEIVIAFIKYYWNYQDVILVDGTNDGGIDIKLFQNKRKRKLPLQSTTDLNTYNKLKKDLKKIAELIDEYDYESKFYFFYSGSASEGKLNELEHFAKTEYDIDLEIIDSKIIGGIAENPNYSLLKKIIIEVIGIVGLENKEYFNQFDKLKYDVYSYGKDAHEIKSSIVESFIINSLFIEGKLKKNELNTLISNKIETSCESGYYDRKYDELKRAKKITVSGLFDEYVELTNQERQRLKEIKSNIDFQEQYFAKEISTLINDYKLRTTTEEVISEIFKLYQSSYQKDYFEIRESIDSHNDTNIVDALRKFINKFTKDKLKSEKIAEEIFEICNLTDFLQRIAATNFFTKLIDNNHLDAYLNKQPKSIILDTSVLLYLMCSYYNNKSSYNNIYYRVTNNLLDYIQNGNIQVKLSVPYSYIEEVSFHILNAYRLNSFVELGFFEKLGGTSNVFIAFYEYLSENEELEYGVDSLKDFLGDFGFDYELSNNEEESLQYLSESIENILESNNVEVFDIPDYYHSGSRKEKIAFSEIKKELELTHAAKRNIRPEVTVINDTFMLSYLYHKECKHPDSFLLTWDNSFTTLRKRYHKKHPKLPYWHLFRPGKLLDHLTLLKFKPNSKYMSLDLLSIVENDFDIQGRVRSLNDILIRILDLKSKSGIALAKGLMEVRTKNIYEVERKDSKIPDFKDTQPIDELLLRLNSFYKSNKGKYNHRDFTNLLNSEIYTEEIIKVINEEVMYFMSNTKFSGKINKNIDLLISKNKTSA